MKKYLIMIILITIIIMTTTVLNQLFGNNVVKLSEINSEEKSAILELMNLSIVSNSIKLEKIETPKTYKDIYYKVYFEIDTNNDIVKTTTNINNDIDIYFEEIKTTKNKAEYCSTISGWKSIKVLEQIRTKYK